MEHPNFAMGLNNLAGLLGATNRLADAEPLYRRALAIDEKSYGTEHPKVGLRVNNLALLLLKTKRLAAAEPLMVVALFASFRNFGDRRATSTRIFGSRWTITAVSFRI